MDPSTYARVVEIASGRTISQQGLVATCKDSAHKGRPEAQGGSWSDAWARSSDEGGVTPSEAAREVAPTLGNALRGQSEPWALGSRGQRAQVEMAGITRSNLPRRDAGWSLNPDEEADKPQWQGVYACQRVSLSFGGQAGLWKSTCKPRPEPHSGNPTVRDRRGALRNVALGTGSRTEAISPDNPPAPKVRALNFYLDIRTYSSKGGRGNGPAVGRRAPVYQ